MRILVIEDNALTADSLTNILQEEGHVVQFVGSAFAALTHLDAPGIPLPEVMVLDLKLPDIDGDEFLGWVQERMDWASIPVILTTAASLDELAHVKNRWPRVKALPKPYDPDRLLEILKDMEHEQLLKVTKEGRHLTSEQEK